MRNTWDEIATINYRIESRDTNANAIQVISNHEVVLLVVIEITIDDEIGNVSICYPIAYIEPLLNKIVSKLLGSGGSKKASKRKDLNTLISGARMEVEAVLAETQLSILELLNLKKDDSLYHIKSLRSDIHLIRSQGFVLLFFGFDHFCDNVSRTHLHFIINLRDIISDHT